VPAAVSAPLSIPGPARSAVVSSQFAERIEGVTAADLARESIAQIPSRLTGSAGELSLASGEAGNLTLADDSSGRVALSKTRDSDGS